MIFKSLSICNFRNFLGLHTIDIRPDKDEGRNIILIGGKNGAGKTTFLEAIKLCLFGRYFLRISDNNYNRYIVSSRNKTAKKNGDPNFYIQLELDTDESSSELSLQLRREWKINNSKIDESFLVYRDGLPLEVVPKEYWQEYILSLIPPHISDYFLFDGEKIKELASGDNAERILKESIRDVIGLSIYETLFSDLDKVIANLKRKNISDKEIIEKYENKENEILEIRNQLNERDGRINENINQVKNLIQRKKEAEAELRRTSGAYAQERKNNESALLKIKENLNKLEDQIKKICGDILPFVIAGGLCKNLLHQLKKEKRLKEIIAGKHILEETKLKIKEKIQIKEKDESKKKKVLREIKKEIDSIFSEMIREIEDSNESQIIHNLSPVEMDSIVFFINSIAKNLKRILKSFLDKREENIIKAKKIKEKLRQVPDELVIKDYIDNISSLQTRIELLENEINVLKEEKNLLEEKLIKENEAIKEFEDNVVCLEEDKRKIDLTNLIQNIIREYNDSIITSGIKEIEKILSNMYKQLANKEDMVKKIKIDKESFNTIMSDYSGTAIDKRNISEGEKEIYALSVLWSLSKVSRRNLPIVIDSPLAKLDSTHVDNIIKKFFPKAGEQVILLSHDREMDTASYQILKPYVSKSYTLSLDETDKIKKGYFQLD